MRPMKVTEGDRFNDRDIFRDRDIFKDRDLLNNTIYDVEAGARPEWPVVRLVKPSFASLIHTNSDIDNGLVERDLKSLLCVTVA